jgi:hypothetical protein
MSDIFGGYIQRGQLKMSDREELGTIPKSGETAVEDKKEKEPITQEEADYVEKVFFEDDDLVQLRDGKSYRMPPLGLKQGRLLVKKMNTINTGIIIENLIDDEEGVDRYDELLNVLLMGFRPYYPHMTVEYLEEYIDLVSAKKIIDSMIGLNGLKKLL